MFSSLVDVNLVLFCDRVETSMKMKISKSEDSYREICK